MTTDYVELIETDDNFEIISNFVKFVQDILSKNSHKLQKAKQYKFVDDIFCIIKFESDALLVAAKQTVMNPNEITSENLQYKILIREPA